MNIITKQNNYNITIKKQSNKIESTETTEVRKSKTEAGYMSRIVILGNPKNLRAGGANPVTFNPCRGGSSLGVMVDS